MDAAASTAILSPNGGTVTRAVSPATRLHVATVQGVWTYERAVPDGAWSLAGRSLIELPISALLHEPRSGRLFAGTHGGKGLWACDDASAQRPHWRQLTQGLTHPHIYTLAAQDRGGTTVLFAGTEPVGLFRSDDLGESWSQLTGLLDVPDQNLWAFPPPPHLAHVKHIAWHPSVPTTLWVCIEQGALLKSSDDGASWTELAGYESAAAMQEKFRRDNHRVVIRPSNPDELLMSGGEGLYFSPDAGHHWDHRLTRADRVGYPDAMFLDPRDENVVYLAGPRHAPREWAARRLADATVLRSTDFGHSWDECADGLPQPVVGNIEAMGLHHVGDQIMLSAGTATGEVFIGDGKRWQVLADDIAPISKAGHYRWFLTDEKRLQIEAQMRAWKVNAPA